MSEQPIEIVEGFIVLESDNGKLKMSSVDTVEEMFAKYYPKLLKHQDSNNTKP